MNKLLLSLVVLFGFSGHAQLELSGSFVAEGSNLGCAYNPQYQQRVFASMVPSGPSSYGRLVTVEIQTAPTSPHQFDCTAQYSGAVSSNGNGGYTGGLVFQSCSCVPARMNQACQGFIDAFYGEPAGTALAVEEIQNGFAITQLRQAPQNPRWPCGAGYPTLNFIRQ